MDPFVVNCGRGSHRLVWMYLDGASLPLINSVCWQAFIIFDFIFCILSPILLVQEAFRVPSSAPAPGPIPHGVTPGHYLGFTTPIILRNANGMQVHVLPIGATIQRLIVPNGKGVAEDVVLGFDDPQQYQVRIWHSSLTIFALLQPTV